MGKGKEFYFNTHDLLMMAAFAAVGGIASSYINMLGDFFQSLLGFAGTTQWAAGLHILWLMMAALIIRKPGAASLAGVLKGGVEFFSGNTHGLLVLIINIAAGLIIDLVFLLNHKKSTFNIWFYLAAGLSAVSNIFVFQIFASLPTEILTIVAIGIASIGAFISGIIFGGVLVRSIILAVEKAGFYSQVPNENPQRKGFPVVIILLCIIGLVGISLVYLGNQTSVEEIYISGNIQNPYSLTENISEFEQITVTAEMNGIERDYQGYRLSEIIERAQPLDLISNLSVEASDGYSFFIPLDEVFTNENLILAEKKSGESISYNVVGAISPKAWIRGVSKLTITQSSSIEVTGEVQKPFIFIPYEWQGEMDSAFVSTEEGELKLQGVPLRKIISYSQPVKENSKVTIYSTTADAYHLTDGEQLAMDDDIQVFLKTTDAGIEFILGKLNGEVILREIDRVEID